jgi:hypothetical protein
MDNVLVTRSVRIRLKERLWDRRMRKTRRGHVSSSVATEKEKGRH